MADDDDANNGDDDTDDDDDIDDDDGDSGDKCSSNTAVGSSDPNLDFGIRFQLSSGQRDHLRPHQQHKAGRVT